MVEEDRCPREVLEQGGVLPSLTSRDYQVWGSARAVLQGGDEAAAGAAPCVVEPVRGCLPAHLLNKIIGFKERLIAPPRLPVKVQLQLPPPRPLQRH
eukprot:CAMPEP_0117671932 /NCGR_PEP_ID=MMETSP0804-20121206/13622_1 /TAXON_ID=1074897 /ORGANISM="Tetraselmis astigmatica, Strain CCMP880" /LENGTH=96 /DNA_ID=CAMNT_0005480475 /DNA_START=907 /DNA_END=1197 /DNA_ORIENTATION=+